MNLASDHWHHTWPILKDTIILLEKPLEYVIIGLALTVTQIAVIYVEAYIHLCNVNHLAGDVRILRVDLKHYACETVGEI